MKRKKELLILLLIFIIGISVRFTNLHDNFFFGYDQGRDIQRIYDIVQGKHLKLVGPETDIPGVFNGPLLYYLLLPGYLLTNFNPNSAAFLLLLINSLGIIILYFAGKELFNSKVGLLAAFFWAISYQQANYGRYISNTGLMPIFATLFFVGLGIYYLKKKNIWLTLSFVGYALAVHVAFYFIYLAIFYLLLWKRVRWRTFLKSGLIGLFLLLPFIIAELRFGSQTSHSLLIYFSQKSTIENPAITFFNYIGSLTNSLYYSFFSFNFFFIFLFFIVSLIYIFKKFIKTKEELYLFIWIFSTLPLFAFKSGVVTGQSIQSSMIGGVTLLISITVYELYKSNYSIWAGLIVFSIIFSNFILFSGEKFINSKLFAYQPMLYRDEKALIDYTYSLTPKKEFSICALTNPFFINTLWSSLYKIYGEKKYGYIPYWSGQKQYLNKSFMSYDRKHVEDRYLIIEPPSGVTGQSIKSTVYLEDQVSKLIEEKRWGSIIVQKRKLLKGEAPQDTQHLSPEEIANIEYINKLDPRYSCFIDY